MDHNSLRDFTKKDELSDVTLVVEDTKLYVHKQYLAEWSPVWRRMFISGMLEEVVSPMEIPLPGKKLGEIKELLHCIYSTQKPISEENVRYLLELSEEYEMDSMKSRCEDFLNSLDKSLDLLLLAQKHKLKNLYKQCIEFAKTRTLEDLERSPEYKAIPPETIVMIYKEKINMIRDYANELKQHEKKLEHQTEQLSLEKQHMKETLQQIPKLWEMPNKRCYRHMTENSFDYTCRDCNEKMTREVKNLCAQGQYVKRYKHNNFHV